MTRRIMHTRKHLFGLLGLLPLLFLLLWGAAGVQAQTAKPAYPSTVNHSDSLGSSLIADYVLNEGSGAVAHSSAGTGKDLAWVDDSGNASQAAPAWATGGVDMTKGHFESTAAQSQSLQVAYGGAGVTFEVRYRFTGSGSSSGTFYEIGGGCTEYGGLNFAAGRVQMYGVESGCSANSATGYSNAATYAAGDHDVVGVISTTGAMTLYFDGVQQSTGTRTSILQTDTGGKLVIGKGLQGVIETVRQWSVALTPSQSTGLFTAPYPATLYGTSAGTLTVNTPFMSLSSPTSLTMGVTVTGGTGPFFYQWYRALGVLTAGSGNALSGATSATLVDTLPDSHVYSYQVRVTDSTATPNVVTTTSGQGVLYKGVPVAIGFIGDSITGITGAFGTVAQEICQRLGQIAGLRQVTCVDQHVGGTTTGNWVPGQSNYTAAVAAFAAANVTVVSVELGTNGGALSDLQSTASDLSARGYLVYVQGAPFSGNLTTSARLSTLNDGIAAMTNTATIKTSKTAPLFLYGSQHLDELFDGTHPTSQGVDSFANIEASELAQAFFGLGTNVVTTIKRRIQ